MKEKTYDLAGALLLLGVAFMCWLALGMPGCGP